MKKTKIYYFAYGSNLNHRQMMRRCPHAKLVATAKINNYRFAITGYSMHWRGGVATITHKNGSSVWGVVYEIDKDCLYRLDGFEGVKYRHYARKSVLCHFINGKTRRVITYVREPRRLSHSSKRYKNIILRGANESNLPLNYIRSLGTSF